MYFSNHWSNRCWRHLNFSVIDIYIKNHRYEIFRSDSPFSGSRTRMTSLSLHCRKKRLTNLLRRRRFYKLDFCYPWHSSSTPTSWWNHHSREILLKSIDIRGSKTPGSKLSNFMESPKISILFLLCLQFKMNTSQILDTKGSRMLAYSESLSGYTWYMHDCVLWLRACNSFMSYALCIWATGIFSL